MTIVEETITVPASARLAKFGRILQGNLKTSAPLLATEPGAPVLPFKVGISIDMLADAKDSQRTRLRNVIFPYVSRTAYLKAMAAEGSMRHDLQGVPIEPVNDVSRERARFALASRYEFEADPKAWFKNSGLMDPRDAAIILKIRLCDIERRLGPLKKV